VQDTAECAVKCGRWKRFVPLLTWRTHSQNTFKTPQNLLRLVHASATEMGTYLNDKTVARELREQVGSSAPTSLPLLAHLPFHTLVLYAPRTSGGSGPGVVSLLVPYLASRSSVEVKRLLVSKKVSLLVTGNVSLLVTN